MLKLLKYLKKKEWLFAFIAIVFIVLRVWLDLKISIMKKIKKAESKKQ